MNATLIIKVSMRSGLPDSVLNFHILFKLLNFYSLFYLAIFVSFRNL